MSLRGVHPHVIARSRRRRGNLCPIFTSLRWPERRGNLHVPQGHFGLPSSTAIPCRGAWKPCRCAWRSVILTFEHIGRCIEDSLISGGMIKVPMWNPGLWLMLMTDSQRKAEFRACRYGISFFGIMKMVILPTYFFTWSVIGRTLLELKDTVHVLKFDVEHKLEYSDNRLVSRYSFVSFIEIYNYVFHDH